MKVTLCTILGSVLILVMYQVARQHLEGGKGILDHTILPDGTECMVTQVYQNFIEPYYVSFYIKRPNEDWQWYYIDHESKRWNQCEIEFDEKLGKISVYKKKKFICGYLLKTAEHIHPIHGVLKKTPTFQEPPYLPE